MNEMLELKVMKSKERYVKEMDMNQDKSNDIPILNEQEDSIQEEFEEGKPHFFREESLPEGFHAEIMTENVEMQVGVVEKMDVAKGWIAGLFVVHFDLVEGPVLGHVWPPKLPFSATEFELLSFAAFPDCNTHVRGDQI